jgi:hypothetical protein
MSRTPAPLSRPFQPHDLDAESTQRGPRPIALALVGAALLAATFFAWRWFDDDSVHDQVQVLQTLPQSEASRAASTSAVAYPFGQGSASSPGGASPGDGATSPPPVAAKPVVPPTPPGVTTAQWENLIAEVSTRPDAAREIVRLDAYFRFADTVRQFRELTRAADSEPTPALIALARRIDAELDQHIAQRELAGSEAYDIKATVLEVLEPDADAADEKLERWAEGLPRSHTDTDRAAMQRDAEFEQRRKALVQAWSSQQPPARDPKALERDIQQLRQEIYGTPTR